MNRSCRLVLRVVACASLAGVVPACVGGNGATDTPSVPSEPFLIVTPEDARIVAASSAISSRVGHEIGYDVDANLVKEHVAHLHDIYSEGLEAVARGVDSARAAEPEAAARACLVFTKIKLELDEKAREPHARFDGRTGTLLLRVPTQATAFATEQSVASALAAYGSQ